VAEVESTPVPVLEEDDSTARTIAQELRECAGIDARPLLLHESGNRLQVFASAPFAITTPYYASRVEALAPRLPLITATLSLDLLHELLARAASGAILVAVPSEWIARRVESALRQRAPNAERTRVVVANREADMQQLRRDAGSVFVWPGCDDVLSAFEGDECVKPVRLLSEATLDRVRTAVLEAALRSTSSTTPVSTPNGVAVRAASAVLAG
jgi:hypothetical protein